MADAAPLFAPPLAALQPMEAMKASRPFTSAEWAFELCAGGHRMLAEFGAGTSRLHSRHHVDITHWFPEIGRALAVAGGRRTVVDGEICVLDGAGRNDPRRLHARALHPGRRAGDGDGVLCIRDLLVHEGQDVRGLPWSERRALLKQLALPATPLLRVERALLAEGLWLHRQALALGRRGIVAKRRSAPYRGGRCADWLLIDCPAAMAA